LYAHRDTPLLARKSLGSASLSMETRPFRQRNQWAPKGVTCLSLHCSLFSVA
jgi:hypothetical protein